MAEKQGKKDGKPHGHGHKERRDDHCASFYLSVDNLVEFTTQVLYSRKSGEEIGFHGMKHHTTIGHCDHEVCQRLSSMGWHCITIWECELKPYDRERTLESLAFTLNKIFLQDHSIRRYEILEDKPTMAAEEVTDEYGKEDKE